MRDLPWCQAAIILAACVSVFLCWLAMGVILAATGLPLPPLW